MEALPHTPKNGNNDKKKTGGSARDILHHENPWLKEEEKKKDDRLSTQLSFKEELGLKPPPMTMPTNSATIKLPKDIESTWLDTFVNSSAARGDFQQKSWLQKIAQSGKFNIFTTVIICINGLIIGIETDHGDGSLGWEVVEYIFLVVYTVELAIRLCADGLRVLKYDGWTRFDFFVMFVAYLDLLVISPVSDKGEAEDGRAQQIAMVLRIVRLMKLTRIMRLLRVFEELWLLIKSFASAFKTLVWTFVLLILCLYLFAILFVKMLGDEHKDKPGGNPLIAEWFGTLPSAMFTLYQIVTLEGWADIGREVWATDQGWMLIVILIFIMITNMAIMNTVTAVIVEHTLTEAMDHTDEMMRKAQKDLQENAQDLVHIFCQADGDANGMVSKHEFVEALTNPSARRQLQEMGLGEDFSCLECDEIAQLFETIDIDNSGELTPQEFVKGMMQMRGNARARSLFEMDCRVQKMHHINRLHYDKKMMRLADQISELDSKVQKESRQNRDRHARIEKQLEAISAHLGIAPAPQCETPQLEPEVTHTRALSPEHAQQGSVHSNPSSIPGQTVGTEGESVI